MQSEDKQQFTITSKLLDRGWTGTLIAKFMPEPDQLKPNPRYKNSAPMRLYKLERVEQIESTDNFKLAKEKSVSRKQSAQKAVSTKITKTMAYVDEKVAVKVPKMTKDRLIFAACESYNDWQTNNDNWSDNYASKDSNPLFLQRICVNYLRHEMTDYDYHLSEVYGKVGIDNACLAIRKKIFAAIKELYPWLAGECNRQQE